MSTTHETRKTRSTIFESFTPKTNPLNDPRVLFLPRPFTMATPKILTKQRFYKPNGISLHVKKDISILKAA